MFLRAAVPLPLVVHVVYMYIYMLCWLMCNCWARRARDLVIRYANVAVRLHISQCYTAYCGVYACVQLLTLGIYIYKYSVSICTDGRSPHGAAQVDRSSSRCEALLITVINTARQKQAPAALYFIFSSFFSFRFFFFSLHSFIFSKYFSLSLSLLILYFSFFYIRLGFFIPAVSTFRTYFLFLSILCYMTLYGFLPGLRNVYRFPLSKERSYIGKGMVPN